MVHQGSQTVEQGDQTAEAAALTATVLTAVERQLSRYFSAMTQRVDSSLAAADRLRSEARVDLDAQRAAAEAYQQALQFALDERLAEVATHNTTRLDGFDVRLTSVASQPAGVSPEELLQIRQVMREDIWRSLAPVTERLDALADANRGTDEQAAALVQHVNTTTATLVTRIDDGDTRATAAASRHVSESADALTTRIAEVESAAAEVAAAHEQQLASLAGAVESSDTRSAAAVAAASERIAVLEHRLAAATLQLATLATKVDSIDQDAMEDLKAQMSAAVGEAMLVRIELDRVQTTMDDKLDKTTVRLGEIEGLLTDEMDVGAAVQLERLDELERAVSLLDPDEFVRKAEILTNGFASHVNSRREGADHSSRGPSATLDTRPDTRPDIDHLASHGGTSNGGSHDSSYHDDTHSSDEYSSS